MGETIKIVVEGFPVELLPKELRERLTSDVAARITIEQAQDQGKKQPRPLHQMRGFAQGLYASQGIDPVDFVRQLRDEWD